MLSLTLHRERNGWCIGSAQLWLALEHKNLRYETVRVLASNAPALHWPDGTVQTDSVAAIRALDAAHPAAVPLWRPRVDAWALASTSAPSLLGLNSSDTGSPSASGPSSTRAGAFASQRAAVQASWPGAAGWGQNALAPRLAAHLPVGGRWLAKPSRHGAAPRLR